jgi:hypothetical protein
MVYPMFKDYLRLAEKKLHTNGTENDYELSEIMTKLLYYDYEELHRLIKYIDENKIPVDKDFNKFYDIVL